MKTRHSATENSLHSNSFSRSSQNYYECKHNRSNEQQQFTRIAENKKKLSKVFPEAKRRNAQSACCLCP